MVDNKAHDVRSTPPHPRWELEVGYLSDPGRQRDLDEDSFLVMLPPTGTPDIEALVAVADGMGGHQAGEVASEMVVTSMARWFSAQQYRQQVTYGPQHDDYFVVVLKELLEWLNSQVYDLAARQPQLSGMGTTATVVLVQGAHFYLGHVGDSRAYLLRQDVLCQLTQDHTWVTEQVQSGQMRHDQAAHHPKRHVLTQALGHGPVVRPERQKQSLHAGDTLLLCSDGLSAVVPDETLRQVLLTAPDAQSACDELVSLANQGGGPDNITVVVVRALRQVQDGGAVQPGGGRGQAVGPIIGPADRSRAVGGSTHDTLNLKREGAAPSADAEPGVSSALVCGALVLGTLVALGLGWVVHFLPVSDLVDLEWASAGVAVLVFWLGLLLGRALCRR